jgi:hypothetical protein
MQGNQVSVLDRCDRHDELGVERTGCERVLRRRLLYRSLLGKDHERVEKKREVGVEIALNIGRWGIGDEVGRAGRLFKSHVMKSTGMVRQALSASYVSYARRRVGP